MINNVQNEINDVVSRMEKYTKRLLRRREQYLKAWIAETGYKPSECMLVEAEDKYPKLNFVNSKVIFIVPVDKLLFKQTLEQIKADQEARILREKALSKLSEEEKKILGVK